MVKFLAAALLSAGKEQTLNPDLNDHDLMLENLSTQCTPWSKIGPQAVENISTVLVQKMPPQYLLKFDFDCLGSGEV